MDKRKLLITHCSTLGASETFIRTHIERLPFHTFFVHQLPPKLVDMETYNPGEGSAVDALEDHTKSYSEILQLTGAEVVLAEYGPSGVAVLKACKQLGVPLLVHFHGFDASMHNVLKHYEKSYNELFNYASEVVAVSSAMRTKLVALGAPPKKLKIIPYGVDTSHFQPSNPDIVLVCSSTTPG